MIKTALITGGSAGLGAALVRHFAASGYRVYASYRGSADSAQSLETEFPGQVHMVQADLACPEGRRSLVESVGGKIDLLINNLGVYPEAYIEDIETDLFESVFRLTCTANYDVTRRCLPLMEEGGRVINIGDSGADRIEARAQATPYHIAKLGVHVLTRTFAQRLGPKHITVNMVSPGFLENSVGEPGEAIPLGEPTRFSDIMAAIDYLVSERARHVSGTNLLVNGGWNLG